LETVLTDTVHMGKKRTDTAVKLDTEVVRIAKIVAASFSQRRKTLRAALATWAGSAAGAERILRAARVDPGARGESLGVAEFARIAAAAQAEIP